MKKTAKMTMTGQKERWQTQRQYADYIKMITGKQWIRSAQDRQT